MIKDALNSALNIINITFQGITFVKDFAESGGGGCDIR
jgi:hypothetical protein